MTFPSFSVNEVLRAEDMNAVGRWRVAAGTMTNVGTGGAFAQNVFSTDYTVHKVMFYDIIASVANGTFIQLANGTTESAVNYYAAGQFVLFATNTGGNTNTNNGNSWVLSSPSTAPRASSEWTFVNVSKAVPTSILAQKQNWDAAETINGYHNPSTAYTGFRVFTNTGTVSLKYVCYGYKD